MDRRNEEGSRTRAFSSRPSWRHSDRGEAEAEALARDCDASLLYEAGATPAYVMNQMGHTSSALALEVYAKKMARSRDTGERMDALIRAADWAQKGANGSEAVAQFTVEKTGIPV